jgi:hypothetical protein
MMSSIPRNNELIGPLRQLLDIAAKSAGSSKKTALTRVALSTAGWPADHSACFEGVKRALINLVPLSHPRDDMAVCLFTDPSDQFWGAVATQVPQRLCVIAHQGASGHRRIAVTTKSVAANFIWKTLEADVEKFVRGCLHCKCVDGDMIPRSLGSALHAEKPNELIHFDWLSMPQATDGSKYVLVIKDDMSGFVQLHPSGTAGAVATAKALMAWFTTFGYVETWVSDGGSHFKNNVLEKVRKMIGAHHHITSAYSPWANGTVEVVNRLVLRGLLSL